MNEERQQVYQSERSSNNDLLTMLLALDLTNDEIYNYMELFQSDEDPSRQLEDLKDDLKNIRFDSEGNSLNNIYISKENGYGVYDVYKNALGVEVGNLQTFRQLLAENPNVTLTFWRLWYFGFIP
jgi:hypothetical protein